MVFKSEFGVKNQSKELGFIYYFNSRVSQKDVRVREKSILLVEVDAHRLWSGELKTVIGHPILNAVNAQLLSPFHSVQRLAPHTQSKVVHKLGAIRTLQDSVHIVVNFDEQGWRQDATLRDPHLLLVKLKQSGAHSNPERTFGQEAVSYTHLTLPTMAVV